MTVLNYYVTSGPDDGSWSTTANEFSNSGVIVIGNFAGNRYHGFFRFVDVLIPQGAELDEADILLQFSTGTGTNVSWRVQAQAQDDAIVPANRSEALAMSLTSTYQDWTVFPTPTPGTIQPVSSPDIVSVVQEVIDRPGWEPGNAILIAVRDIASASSNNRFVVSYNTSPEYAAVLSIEYTPPPNTAPTITVSPSVNYNGYTRTGPNNSPVSVSFEAEDAEETGTDELTVEVRTAAAGGGTLVATDDYTSGTAGSISIAHNASGLSEGSNTLYMRVGDGTDWSDDEPFTLLVDRTQPADFTPSHTPDPVLSDGEYQVTITANDSHSTGTNELTVEVRTGASGTGTLLWTGSRTSSGTPFNTTTIEDLGLVNGANNRYVRIIDGAGNVREKLLEVEALIVIEEDKDDVLAALLVLDPDEQVGGSAAEGASFPLSFAEAETIHNLVFDELLANVSLSEQEEIGGAITENLAAGIALSLDEMVSSTLEEPQGFPLVMPGVELVTGTVEESDNFLLTAGLLETLSQVLLINEVDSFELALLSTFEEILTGLLDQENWDLAVDVTLQSVTAETSESQDLLLSLDVTEAPEGLVSDSDAWTFTLASSEAVQAAVVEAVTLRLAAGLLESLGIGIIERENLNLLVVAAEQISAMFTEEELLAVALGESESSSGLVREDDGSWGLSLSGVENSAGEVLEADVWALLLGVDERLSAALLEAEGWNLELAVSERQMFLFHEVDNFLLTAGTDSTIQSLVSEYAELKLMMDATGQSVAGSVVEAWQFTMVLQELERQLTNLLETENWDVEIEETLDRYWIGATPVRIGLVKLLGRALLAKLERDR